MERTFRCLISCKLQIFRIFVVVLLNTEQENLNLETNRFLLWHSEQGVSIRHRNHNIIIIIIIALASGWQKLKQTKQKAKESKQSSMGEQGTSRLDGEDCNWSCLRRLQIMHVCPSILSSPWEYFSFHIGICGNFRLSFPWLPREAGRKDGYFHQQAKLQQVNKGWSSTPAMKELPFLSA